jgi:hypothetical protein
VSLVVTERGYEQLGVDGHEGCGAEKENGIKLHETTDVHDEQQQLTNSLPILHHHHHHHF